MAWRVVFKGRDNVLCCGVFFVARIRLATWGYKGEPRLESDMDWNTVPALVDKQSEYDVLTFPSRESKLFCFSLG